MSNSGPRANGGAAVCFQPTGPPGKARNPALRLQQLVTPRPRLLPPVLAPPADGYTATTRARLRRPRLTPTQEDPEVGYTTEGES